MRSRLRLRALSVAVLGLVAVLALAGCLITRQVVADQEHRLLKQRTEEAALYVSSALSSVEGTLANLSATAAVNRADPTAFSGAARLLTAGPQGFRSIALIRLGANPTVVAVAGSPIAVADQPARLSAAVAAASHAGVTGAVTTTPVFPSGDGGRALGFAYASPTLSGYAVYAENEIHPGQQSATTSSQPFSELEAAIYAGPTADPSQLLTSTASNGLSLHGNTASAKAPVGATTVWLLVTKARHPLVGSIATLTPWAVLGAGLLAAALATTVVETLARRREYALGVADERTAELKESMAELAVAHEQLVRQERLAAIGQLASTIGHELRNPLGIISNALYLLRSDVGPVPTEAAERHLGTAEREVSAATVIVSDLLEFARQREPVQTDVDLAGLVEEIVAVLPPPSGVTVDRQLPSPFVGRADRDMLRQVLINLVGNAYQAMPDGGRLLLAGEARDGSVRLHVADTGSGMTDEVKSRLFEPFFTTKARGVGLGLAVSKRIVDAHGGDLVVRSAPGEGSEFVVALPQIARQRLPADDEIAASRVAGGLRS